MTPVAFPEKTAEAPSTWSSCNNAQWPKDRTREMFQEWFDVQMCPVIEDLHVDEELVELD